MFKFLGPVVFTGLAVSALCAVIGWIMNLITLVHWVGEITPEFLIRAVGIVVPIIGAIMGWL
ncbi:hypothetical protein [Rhizobium sp. IMFF44]|uniref:hypothetical protein n=1 Tax=Rhizobium sp. IMFF44 TaxID=3342350 RepID=UPI0035BA8553